MKKGSRKVITGLIILLCGIGSLLLKGDVPPGFLTLLQTIFAAFVVGNAAEHISCAFTRPEALPQLPQVDHSQDIHYLTEKLEKVDVDVNNLSSNLDKANESLTTVQKAISFVISKAFPNG